MVRVAKPAAGMEPSRGYRTYKLSTMSLLHEIRHAVRSLIKSPGFTIVAVVTLALGIGANTAIFSIINSVLLSPLRYNEPDRIVTLATTSKETGRTNPRLTGGDLVDIRGALGDSGQIFAAISYYYGGEMGVQLAGRAEFTGVFFVNPEFFAIFGVPPAYGHAFDGEKQATVSIGFAERNFGDAARALGRTVRVENETYPIVGVLPAGFAFPQKADVWVAASATPQNLNRTAYNYPTIARLKRDIPLDAAQTALATVGARLAAAYPDSNRNKSFAAVPLRDQLVGSVRSMLYFLMGAVALVLLIACTNVADLMLARATARSREMALRAALGAGRWHIIRPLLVESLLLALLGGTLGLLFAWFGTGALAHLSANRVPLPRLTEIHVDRLVLVFVSAISVLTSVLFGLIPAWQSSRVDLHDALKQGSRSVAGSRSPHLRNALVVAQIALSLVLAIGAGLLLRSFASLNSVQLGYRTDGILVMYAHAPAHSLGELVAVSRSFEDIFTRIEKLPGVTSVAAAMGLPAGQYGSGGSYAVEGKQIFAAGQHLPEAGFRLASTGYFATMGIPLSRGRDFSTRDDYSLPQVAIISDALARQSFPNEDPIGQRIQTGFDSSGKWMTVVGVVGDVRQNSPASVPAPELYMPLKQHPYHANEVQVVVRTAGDPGSLTTPVREQVRAANPEIAMKFTTMKTAVSDSIAQPRFRTLLISAFAGLALLLAMVGVYGVMSYVITERTPEFGLRVALGAMPADVIGLVLGKTLRLAAIGLGIGLALSIALSRVMSTMLFDLKPTDPATYAAVLLAVAPVILIAAAIPAWRATRIDPLTALREE
jgi:putative ABC transport system permease protein